MENRFVGGRGLATSSAQNTAQNVPQNCVLLLIRGHRKKGTEKRPDRWYGRDFLAPTPSFHQPLFETSDFFVLLQGFSRFVLGLFGVRIFPVCPLPLPFVAFEQHLRGTVPKGCPRHNPHLSWEMWEIPRFGNPPVYLLSRSVGIYRCEFPFLLIAIGSAKSERRTCSSCSSALSVEFPCGLTFCAQKDYRQQKTLRKYFRLQKQNFRFFLSN